MRLIHLCRQPSKYIGQMLRMDYPIKLSRENTIIIGLHMSLPLGKACEQVVPKSHTSLFRSRKSQDLIEATRHIADSPPTQPLRLLEMVYRLMVIAEPLEWIANGLTPLRELNPSTSSHQPVTVEMLDRSRSKLRTVTAP